VVMRAMDHKLPQQKPLEAVRSDVVAAWKKQRGAELAAIAAADAVKRLDAGESWDAVAKSLNVTVSPPKFVSRQDPGVPMEIRIQVFGQLKPQGKPLYGDARLANGDASVIALSAVREDTGAPAGDQKQQDEELRRQFAGQIASNEAQSYAAGARADAKVILNPQAID